MRRSVRSRSIRDVDARVCDAGTREILFPPLPYIAVYRIGEEAIEVIRIYHGARDVSSVLRVEGEPAD